jgi:hypothetical protein
MVVLTWPLWIDLPDFPAVPFVRWFPEYPRRWSWLGLLGVVAGLLLALSERAGRAGLVISSLIFGWLILGDQLRLQPWVYQYLVMATLLATLPPRSALAFSRIYLASMYLHSGLSKLDSPFVAELGRTFALTLARVAQLDASRLLTPGRERLVLAMPAFEIAAAVLLLIRPTRVIGYVCLVLIHGTLLVILGPWGLGHSAAVLAWNVALAVEENLAFWPTKGVPPVAWKWGRREKLIGVPFALLCLLPFVERLAVFDSWPSHALYASHCERSAITIQGERFFLLPVALRVSAVPRTRMSETWDLNPTAWTRAVRGVPAYPQARYANGLAEWIGRRLAARDATHPTARVFVRHTLRPDPLTGERGSLDAADVDSIRDEGDRFWFNAHPRGARGR